MPPALASSVVMLFSSSAVGLASSPVVLLLLPPPRRREPPAPGMAKASCRFPFMGPTRSATRRRYRNAVFAASRVAVSFARVVRAGWTTSVAARAKCWGGGRKAGGEGVEEVPAVRRENRRFRAWESVML